MFMHKTNGLPISVEAKYDLVNFTSRSKEVIYIYIYIAIQIIWIYTNITLKAKEERKNMEKKWNAVMMTIMILALLVSMEVVEAHEGSCEESCVIRCGGGSGYLGKICQNQCLVNRCNYPPETNKLPFSFYVYANIFVIVSMCYSACLTLYVAKWTRFIILKYKLYGDIEGLEKWGCFFFFLYG